eukprot:SAG31_NODE_16195_length_719_cov_1.001613_1_plen_111_part_00
MDLFCFCFTACRNLFAIARKYMRPRKFTALQHADALLDDAALDDAARTGGGHQASQPVSVESLLLTPADLVENGYPVRFSVVASCSRRRNCFVESRRQCMASRCPGTNRD